MNEKIVSETTYIRPAPALLRRISWGAIFAGLAVALVTQIVFTMLGLAVGATAMGPVGTADKGTAQSYGLGAIIWFGVTAIISTWFGAWVAGRFSGGPRTTDGMLHGLVTWASATLLTAFLLTSAIGNLLGGTAKLLGQTVSAAGQAGGQMAAKSGSGQSFAEQARNMIPGLAPTGRTEGQGNDLMSQAKNNPQLMTVVTRMMAKGGASQDPQDRQEAISLLTSSGMSEQQASSTVDQWDRQYQQTKENAKETVQQAGQTVVTGTAYGAWSAFILLVLCGAAGAFGGWLGSRGLPYIRAEERGAAAA